MSVNTKILLVVLENPLQQLLYTIGAVLFRKETQKKKKNKKTVKHVMNSEKNNKKVLAVKLQLCVLQFTWTKTECASHLKLYLLQL